ncbi:MAG: SufE family protein [Chthoniobacteraceae bacterium]
MSIAEKERRMVDRWMIIPDSHERLNAITTRYQKAPRLDEAERAAVGRVPGCVSAVWLRCSYDGAHCRFTADAESPLVRSLVMLLAELYDGELAPAVAAHEPQLLEALGIAQSLSPTRLNGLASVRTTIREYAVALVG